MKLLWYIPFLCLTACTAVGVIDNKETSLGGALSLLGDQRFRSLDITTARGAKVRVQEYATENPSKNATDIAKRYLMWEGMKYMIGTAADLDKLRVQAAHAEKLKEFDLTAQQQGFTHELNMLNAQPTP